MKSFRTFIIVVCFVICIVQCEDKNCSYLNIESSGATVTLLNQTNLYTLAKYNVSASEFNMCQARVFQSGNAQKNFISPQENDTEEQPHPTLVHLTDYLYSSLPPFDLSSTPGVSKKCKVHSQEYISGLKELKLWALKMYDASAKIPSGFLNGNINQLGDFDLCLSSQSDKHSIKGQYCLAYLQVEKPKDRYVNTIYQLVYAHSPFKSNLNDPGHRVPRYSTINWALCVPDSCTAQDIELGLQQSVTRIFNGTDLDIQLKVDPEMCQTISKPLPTSTILAILFFTIVIMVTLASTAYDYYKTDQKAELLVAFSLRKNLSALTSTERSSNDINVIHGVRFTNAFVLIFAHKSMALFFLPYMNRTEMSEIIGQPWTVLGRAASLYTDPFIMLAGTLTAYSFYGKLQRTNKINILQEYVSRLFRIVPSLAALIMFCTFVLPWLNSGPQWNLVVTHHSHICKKYWWRNLLFIHNYFGFKDMCLTHTHHVGIDTQLFFISPFLIMLIWKWQKRGIAVLAIWAAISTVMRYYVTYTKKLSNYVHYGTSIEQLFDTADYMYILPSHRITVYIMGVFLGCSLQCYKKVQLSSFQLFLGNVVALLSFCAAFIGPAFMGDVNYVYRPFDAACYAAFAPILWCLTYAWIIFKTQNGYSDSIGSYLSWKGFLVWTRISYAVYLTQFPIFFYNVGITRTSEYYGFFSKNFNASECVWIFFLAVVLTVLFELPFHNIRTMMLKNKTKVTKVEADAKIN